MAPAPRNEADLSVYRQKRDFSKTSEPGGDSAGTPGHRFVVQKHDATRLHYDFRLELDGVLKSWAVTRGPSLDPSEKRLAVRTEDHPVDYAAFEGVIPEGQYGAGTVIVWDHGDWEPVGDPHEGLADGKLTFLLYGERMKGEWALIRMRGGKSRADAKRENWLLIKADDAEANREADILDAVTSVNSGRDLAKVTEDAKHGDAAIYGKPTKRPGKPAAAQAIPSRSRKANLPDFVEPQLCALVEDVPKGDDWLYEIKFDGYRAIVAADGDAVRISTRNGLDWTDRFAPLARAVGSLGLSSVLIDGEIVVLDNNGVSDFGALQNAIEEGGGRPVLFAFDFLVENGQSIADRPLTERKARLAALLKAAPKQDRVFFSDHVEGDGAAMLGSLCEKGFEGIIAKRADAPYRPGRRDWLKIKCGHQQEFVIAGTSPSTRGRPFASLLLGVQEKDGLRYAGRVGSGLSGAELDRLEASFAKLQRKTSPFVGEVPREIARDARWLKPELVAEIAFAGWTRDNLVRQGRFLALRSDKAADKIVIEKPAKIATKDKTEERETPPMNVRLTHPERVLYPDENITKADLAAYLQAVGPKMLPHVERRILSLVRCPDGAEKACFFQKHASRGMPEAFHEIPVSEKDGGKEDYLYVDTVDGLVSAAQIGGLELHIWGSHIDTIEQPDRIVFDFDPDESVAFEEVRQAAVTMREALDALGLKSFPLLTGGKGIHVVVPILPEMEWPAVKGFARALAEHFATNEPNRYVATMSKARRKGKIFIDHFRNERGSTAIAPFSPRARAGAPVAWPVAWDALPGFKAANAVTIANHEQQDTDGWKGYFDVRQKLTATMLKALGVKE
ncbi:DNA ligase D [Kaistia algarum]|uniref:DNA ligase D n=1 Tax=Kaistia algarum TaxID=2083279 RepID=UPI000CE71D72|nr:DNA ligase D [Kaistia algarum]MCX5515325.1 DNA ligase D [Kaistia algarum]PPE77876.1 DNA ligase D [Kaistia algarum]